jgi:hypothetical protein
MKAKFLKLRVKRAPETLRSFKCGDRVVRAGRLQSLLPRLKLCDHCGSENDDLVVSCRECGTSFGSEPQRRPQKPWLSNPEAMWTLIVLALLLQLSAATTAVSYTFYQVMLDTPPPPHHELKVWTAALGFLAVDGVTLQMAANALGQAQKTRRRLAACFAGLAMCMGCFLGVCALVLALL